MEGLTENSSVWTRAVFLLSLAVVSKGQSKLLETGSSKVGRKFLNNSTMLRPVLSDSATNDKDQVKDLGLLHEIAADIEETALGPRSDFEDTWQGRGRKRKNKKGEVQFLMKALMGLKVALLGIILPFGVIAAKVLSWKAVTLSLMAFMLAKIVFVKNLFMSKSTPTPAPAAQPPAPIVIHSSAPSHDHVWKRQSDPQIHVKPEVHLHQSEEQYHSYDDSKGWGWSEGRANKDPHDIVFRNWAPK